MDVSFTVKKRVRCVSGPIRVPTSLEYKKSVTRHYHLGPPSLLPTQHRRQYSLWERLGLPLLHFLVLPIHLRFLDTDHRLENATGAQNLFLHHLINATDLIIKEFAISQVEHTRNMRLKQNDEGLIHSFIHGALWLPSEYVSSYFLTWQNWK